MRFIDLNYFYQGGKSRRYNNYRGGENRYVGGFREENIYENPKNIKRTRMRTILLNSLVQRGKKKIT